jgi:hypothetical protein
LCVYTYSLTFWLCKGCRYGLLQAALDVAPSGTACDGRVILVRETAGLKSPGEETGVRAAERSEA